MGNKEYLNVNELATLFGLKVQTLHYYDKIGILKPSYRDPNNGYRKYRFDQTYKLASIRYMRKLGYSIEAVRDFFTNLGNHTIFYYNIAVFMNFHPVCSRCK